MKFFVMDNKVMVKENLLNLTHSNHLKDSMVEVRAPIEIFFISSFEETIFSFVRKFDLIKKRFMQANERHDKNYAQC